MTVVDAYWILQGLDSVEDLRSRELLHMPEEDFNILLPPYMPGFHVVRIGDQSYGQIWHEGYVEEITIRRGLYYVKIRIDVINESILWTPTLCTALEPVAAELLRWRRATPDEARRFGRWYGQVECAVKSAVKANTVDANTAKWQAVIEFARDISNQKSLLEFHQRAYAVFEARQTARLAEVRDRAARAQEDHQRQRLAEAKNCGRIVPGTILDGIGRPWTPQKKRRES